jgi:2-polyprenyl-6-methoxyphenol hydroxylase-like FAD-dependent oxidoreductase
VVAGGSLGGLFAGLFLRRIGWDVTIHERVGQELGSRGAGIVTHDVLQEKLALATGNHEPVGVPVKGRVVLDLQGGVICENTRPQLLASWDRLWRRLRDAANGIYKQPSTLVSFEQDADGVTVNFAEGESIRADILVCADGIRSTARRLLLPDASPRYAGYIAWRGLVDEATLSAATRDALMDRFGFCLPPQEQMLGYPVDGADGEGRRYNYVWYRAADTERDLPRLFTGTDGKFHGDSIPPDRLRPDVLAEMRDAATRLLAPQFAEIVHKTRQPLLQAIADLEVPRMAIGRVVLLGDAAFVARPHVGGGVAKAAGDAAALVAALQAHEDVPAALGQYQAQRLPAGRRMVQRARHLGAYLQASRSNEEAALAARHSVAENVLEETATLDFLYS